MRANEDEARPERRRRRFGTLVLRCLLALLLLTALGLGALFALPGGRGLLLRGYRLEPPLVVLDEAFALSHPELSSALKDLATPLAGRPLYRVEPLSAGPAAFLQDAAALGFKPLPEGSQGAAAASPSPAAAGIIASPLYAAALLEGGRGLGGPGPGAASGGLEALGGAVLVLPEWPGDLPQGMAGVRTEASGAFGAAGRAAGSYIAALRAAGSQGASAAILFREGPLRDAGCLEAFAEGYAEAGLDPVHEELPGGGQDSGVELDATLARILEMDVRFVFVALGADSLASCEKLKRPGLALGAEISNSAEAGDLALAIHPDFEGLARALALLAREGGREDLSLPALLEAGSGARDYPVGQGSLADHLAAAGAFPSATLPPGAPLSALPGVLSNAVKRALFRLSFGLSGPGRVKNAPLNAKDPPR